MNESQLCIQEPFEVRRTYHRQIHQQVRMARRFTIVQEKILPVEERAIDYSSELNEQQFEAATRGTGAALLVAGAGTGKTRTLIFRVAFLVETGVPPDSIVLLTFTRRAASEMISRASLLLDGRCDRVRGGTFHAFCLTILKKYASKIGYPSNFTILDSSDSADVIELFRATKMSRKQGKRFPKKGTLQKMFSSIRNRGITLEHILETSYPQFIEFSEELSGLFIAYTSYKKEKALMDYDDLLVMTLLLFEQEPGVLRQVATGCRHVLVDEFQDTNKAQALLVKALSSVHSNVMAVGDDAQSIYGFRGAEPENMLSFSDGYAGAVVLKLEHNYRSTQPILDLANRLLISARRKYPKELFSDKAGGDLPGLVPAPDTRFESRFVSQLVLQFREQGIALREMAVLFRNGHNSYDLEVELNKKGIPFVKYGGLRLSEAAHIKDVLAHLKIIENPRDTIAWNRVLQLLDGVGPKTAGRIIEWLDVDEGETFALKERPFSGSYLDSFEALIGLLRSIHDSEKSPYEQIEMILDYYAPLLRRAYSEDYPKRDQDLEHLLGLAGQFSDRATMLDSFALNPIDLTVDGTDPVENEELPLVLSTIHSAKGLEFKVVFVIQALDGIIPTAYSVGSKESIDEELRLLYVAVTRAADHLFISFPMIQFRRYDGQYFAKVSRFLEEVPETILEPCTLVEETRAKSLPPSEIDA